MVVERAEARATLLDVLDRVLDKGIVVDAWVRVSLVGIDLVTVEACVVVASIETYILYSDALGDVAAIQAPSPKVAPRLAGSARAGRPQRRLASDGPGESRALLHLLTAARHGPHLSTISAKPSTRSERGRR